ncbi:actin binding calponin [Tanacetum coccineum]
MPILLQSRPYGGKHEYQRKGHFDMACTQLLCRSRLTYVTDGETGNIHDTMSAPDMQNIYIFMLPVMNLVLSTQVRFKNSSKLPGTILEKLLRIQLLPDLDLEKTPQLDECVTDNQDVEELMSPPPKKILLQWMNFKLRKIDYNKTMTNFSFDAEDGEAYALRI